MWDDDPHAEHFRYLNGQLLDNFFSDKKIAQLAKHNGSGECTIADIMGHWREEILITDNDGKLHIYSNEKPTEFPERPYLRDRHNYLMHLASIGSGLPKPVPPDPDLIPSKILEQGKLLDGFRLNQNYTNPFNNETTLEYTISKPGNVDLAVYDTIGQKVGTIDSGFRGANTYKVTWNGERFGSGIYLCKLTYRNSIALRKIIFLK